MSFTRKLTTAIFAACFVCLPAMAEREQFQCTLLAPTATAGTVLFADGTAAAPSMSFSADTNTGLFRSSADILSFSSNAVTTMHYDGNGLVLGNSGTATSGPGTGVLRGTYASGTNIAGAPITIIGGRSTGNAAGGHIAFQTSAAGTSGSANNTLTERMRITSAGNVGIGRTTAVSRLHVEGAEEVEGDAAGQLILKSSTAFGSTPKAGIIFQINQSGSVESYTASINAVKENTTVDDRRTALIFGTRASSGTTTERMRITSGGDVGIGTNSPGARLGVAGSFQLTNSAGTVVLQRCGLGNDSILGTESGTSLLLRTGTTERMRVKADGQVRFIPLAADPASAEAGDVYYNSGTNKLRVYNGTAWVDLH
jgi:hypothetical protein